MENQLYEALPELAPFIYGIYYWSIAMMCLFGAGVIVMAIFGIRSLIRRKKCRT